MLSTLSANDASNTLDPVNGIADSGSAEDSRSSSLSDLDDGGVDQDDTPTKSSTMNAHNDNDSEAETERLQVTPRKLDVVAADTMDSPTKLTKSPSKLAQEVAMDDEMIDASSIADKASNVPSDDEIPSPTAGLDILAGAVDEATKLPEVAGKKRKRSGSITSSVADGLESPSKKRAASVKSTLNGDAEPQETAETDVIDEDIKTPRETGSEEHVETKDGEVEAEAEAVADDVAEEVTEQVVSRAKASKARKGKRKGKKVKDTEGGETPNGPSESVPPDGEEAAEGEVEEEDPATAAEEAARRESALKSIGDIEKDFTIFREKYYNERIAQLDQELELLQQPDCTHPEYLAQVRCVDERRDEKIRLENVTMKYKIRALNARFAAERTQLQSQFFQSMRDLREQTLDRISSHVYQIQRERRNIGEDEREYFIRYNPKRSEQLRQQIAYNQEVSILSGVGKYVGFPAAPDLRGAGEMDIAEDLKQMKIPTRSTNTNAPKQGAESHFLQARVMAEHTHEAIPWANNPQAATYSQGHHAAATGPPARVTPTSYATPAAQRRAPEPNTNGSASTIDMLSNPPSSTAAQGQDISAQSRDADSPLHRRVSGPANNSSYSPLNPLNYTSITPLGRNVAPSADVSFIPQASHFPTSSLHGSHPPDSQRSQKYSPADVYGRHQDDTHSDQGPPSIGFAQRLAAGAEYGRGSGGRY